MHYVYIVESKSSPGRYYVGSTTDVRRRVTEHNEGKSVHSAKHRPWKLATYIAFENRAIDHHVYDRVRNFLVPRRKAQRRGTRRFPAEVVSGSLACCTSSACTLDRAGGLR